MNDERATAVNSNAPFGTLPRRSRGPLLFWIVVYCVWFVALLVLTAGWVGMK